MEQSDPYLVDIRYGESVGHSKHREAAGTPSKEKIEYQKTDLRQTNRTE